MARSAAEADAATARRCIDALGQADHLDVLRAPHAHHDIPMGLQDADDVLRELGFDAAEIARVCADVVVDGQRGATEGDR